MIAATNRDPRGRDGAWDAARGSLLSIERVRDRAAAVARPQNDILLLAEAFLRKWQRVWDARRRGSPEDARDATRQACLAWKRARAQERNRARRDLVRRRPGRERAPADCVGTSWQGVRFEHANGRAVSCPGRCAPGRRARPDREGACRRSKQQVAGGEAARCAARTVVFAPATTWTDGSTPLERRETVSRVKSGLRAAPAIALEAGERLCGHHVSAP